MGRGQYPVALETALGHRFQDRSLLTRALTHASVAPDRLASNQRLEFLGDRVLGLAVADMLYRAFPGVAEGDLSRRLAALVRRETCAEVAEEWGAPDALVMAEAEAQAGGAHKEAILADVCESLIGAVYLDAGFDAALELVRRAFGPRIDQAPQARRDPKSALQEWAQARGLQPPAYRVATRSGPDHKPHFAIEACVDGYAPAVGEGASKRLAEQSAARIFIEREHIVVGGGR